LGLSGCTELAGKAKGVPWTLCNGNREGRAWDLLWRDGGCLGLLLYAKGGRGEVMDEQELPAMKELQNDH
jgi:hypothetical protein